VKVIFTEIARNDLDRIWSYIARDNVRRALSFVRELIAASRKLSDMPRRYPLIAAHEDSGYRRMPYGAYLVFYRIGEDVIEIVRILNAAQDHEAILFPDETPDETE
jgi:addiction module RelE/StbE family toxin